MPSLTKDQIILLYNLTGKLAPENPTTNDISRVLIEIEKMMLPECSLKDKKCEKAGNINILMVDDLELSIYQLAKIIENCGYNSLVARSVEEALDLYKKQSYDYFIIDLFLPNPEDGLNLIDTVNKLEKTKVDDTKIIVISGSDDKTLINECFLRGANEFIGKQPDWHKKLLHHIGNLEAKKYGGKPEVLTTAEDSDKKIASISISNLYKNEVVEILKREIKILLNTGFTNLILDLENVKTIESEGLNTIVYAYREASEKGGSLKLCGVNNTVADALSYVFLSSLIPVFKDKQSALFDYKKEDSRRKAD